MEFLTWWFMKHYIWSTILTPFLTFIWCIWKGGMGWRAFIAFIWWVISDMITHMD